MNAFITYDGLPASSGGAHSLGQKPIRNIYTDTVNFLKGFTNCDKPKDFHLILYSSQTGQYKTLPILWNLIKKFGIPSYGRWNFGLIKQHFYTWNLNHKKLEEALTLLDNYAHLPRNEYGPLVLSLKWEFYFVDPNTKTPFKNQEKIPIIDDRRHNSQLYLRLAQRSTMSAWFAFPFSSLDDVATNYFIELKSHLPFKPSGKHWRIWSKSNSGNWTPRVLDVKI